MPDARRTVEVAGDGAAAHLFWGAADPTSFPGASSGFMADAERLPGAGRGSTAGQRGHVREWKNKVHGIKTSEGYEQ